MRATIANGMSAAGAFGVPAIVDGVIAIDPKETALLRQARCTAMSDGSGLTPRGRSGTLRALMLCRVVSSPELVPPAAVATGVGIELIIVIPR